MSVALASAFFAGNPYFDELAEFALRELLADPGRRSLAEPVRKLRALGGASR